jgi:hypothetical protein
MQRFSMFIPHLEKKKFQYAWYERKGVHNDILQFRLHVPHWSLGTLARKGKGEIGAIRILEALLLSIPISNW